jgi:signal transduction histidine kinase
VKRIPDAAEAKRILSECAAVISRSVDSVKMLVDEFSQLARFPAAKPVASDLNLVVEDALAVFAGRLDGIQVETRLSPGLPAVHLDRDQFQRVVVNLVDNAAEVVTTTLCTPETVELMIADTGCGVSPEEKEKLFLPYFSTKGRGTGLGLAIASHILSEHNAQIRVEDNSPAGTRFTIEIPVPADGAAPEVFPKPSVAAAAPEPELKRAAAGVSPSAGPAHSLVDGHAAQHAAAPRVRADGAG